MDNSFLYLLVGGVAVWAYQTFFAKKPVTPVVPVVPGPVPSPVAPDMILKLALEEFQKFLNTMFQNFFQKSVEAHAEKFQVKEPTKESK